MKVLLSLFLRCVFNSAFVFWKYFFFLSPERAKGKAASLLGVVGEIVVFVRFVLRFYSFVAYRYRTPCGELDLVFKKNGILYFLEVKTSISRDYVGIDKSKMKRFYSSADFFVAKHKEYMYYPSEHVVCFLSSVDGMLIFELSN